MTSPPPYHEVNIQPPTPQHEETDTAISLAQWFTTMIEALVKDNSSWYRIPFRFFLLTLDFWVAAFCVLSGIPKELRMLIEGILKLASLTSEKERVQEVLDMVMALRKEAAGLRRELSGEVLYG